MTSLRPLLLFLAITAAGCNVFLSLDDVELDSGSDASQTDETPDGDVVGDNLSCERGGMCQFECDAGSCEVNCGRDSSCEASCDGGGCNFSCGNGAMCEFTCDGGDCSFDCSGTCPTTCDGGGCTGP